LWKQAGRSILFSAGVRPCYRSGLGLDVSVGELLCGEAKHLVSRKIRIESRAEATFQKQDISFSSIPKLLSKYGDSKMVGAFGRSEGTWT